jgi:hypothetical protein
MTATRKRCLYFSPVSRAGAPLLAKIIERFGHEDFDYLICRLDDYAFEEAVFSRCEFVTDRLPVYFVPRVHLPPERCAGYEYVFFWCDDVDVDRFDPQRFLAVMERNELDVAQPALSYDSIWSIEITLKRDASVGRLTDFVECQAMVFRRDAYCRWWELIDLDGPAYVYDVLLPAVCNRIGIVDCETVTHLRLTLPRPFDMLPDIKRLMARWRDLLLSKCINLGELT